MPTSQTKIKHRKAWRNHTAFMRAERCLNLELSLQPCLLRAFVSGVLLFPQHRLYLQWDINRLQESGGCFNICCLLPWINFSILMLISLAHSQTRNKAMAIGNSAYAHLCWIFSAVNGHLLIQLGRPTSLLLSSMPLDAGNVHTFSLLGLQGHQGSGCHLLWRYQFGGRLLCQISTRTRQKAVFSPNSNGWDKQLREGCKNKDEVYF